MASRAWLSYHTHMLRSRAHRMKGRYATIVANLSGRDIRPKLKVTDFESSTHPWVEEAIHETRRLPENRHMAENARDESGITPSRPGMVPPEPNLADPGFSKTRFRAGHWHGHR